MSCQVENPTSQDEEVRRFDPSVTVESAVTPPSSWFVDDKFHELDQVSFWLCFSLGLGLRRRLNVITTYTG